MDLLNLSRSLGGSAPRIRASAAWYGPMYLSLGGSKGRSVRIVANAARVLARLERIP